MSEPLKHTAGPWSVGGHWDREGVTAIYECNSCVCVATAWRGEKPSIPKPERCANAQLIALSPTAPHVCADPTCPGNVNRLKLAAAERLAESLRMIEGYWDGLASKKNAGEDAIHSFVRAALADWKAAGGKE